MREAAKNDIKATGWVTTHIRKEYFTGCDFQQIRNWLEENGFDRHMMIELESTEIAIQTPCGILMQIRRADHNQLGMWGGVLKDNERPFQGAVRELREETGIEVDESQLIVAGVDEHDHEYANGDKARFKSYRFVVEFDYVPEVLTDEESVGTVLVAHPNRVLCHQREFILQLLEALEE